MLKTVLAWMLTSQLFLTCGFCYLLRDCAKNWSYQIPSLQNIADKESGTLLHVPNTVPIKAGVCFAPGCLPHCYCRLLSDIAVQRSGFVC